MDRKSALLSLFEPLGLGLEIGPSFNPLLPKSEGYEVEILDHLPADQLRMKYAGVDTVDRIEEVDYVWTGEPLSKLIGAVSRYSYIVASHVIEHTVDLLGFLIECEKLLKPDGVLALAIPDKRFAFDVLRPCTSVGDVLQAHLDRRTTHSPGKIFDEVAYNVLRAGQPAWPRNAFGEFQFFASLQSAKAAFEVAQGAGSFVDIHAWQFTPSAFRLVAADLHSCGFLALREKGFLESDAPEFYVTLSRGGVGCSVESLALLERTIAEEREIAVTSDKPEPNKVAGHIAIITALETKLAAAERDKRIYAAQVAALTASRSWRLTAPLRRGARFVRRWRATL